MFSPFIIIDSYQPEYSFEFDKDTLRYEMAETGKYEKSVFVFNIYELPIKYFHPAILYMDMKEIYCTLITFSDDSQIYCTLALQQFVEEIITEYIIKTNEGYTDIQSGE
jgi:hypothetical protein